MNIYCNYTELLYDMNLSLSLSLSFSLLLWSNNHLDNQLTTDLHVPRGDKGKEMVKELREGGGVQPLPCRRGPPSREEGKKRWREGGVREEGSQTKGKRIRRDYTERKLKLKRSW